MISSDLYKYLLYMADDVHILGHRLGEWCGHGPTLEQDIALTNLALDLIGQSRMFYQYTANAEGNGQTEDSLAYLRDSFQYRNCLMVELPNGHFGTTVMKLFLFSHFKSLQYRSLCLSEDTTIVAIAAKSLKEINYHVKFSDSWVKRLGDGTEGSHKRMNDSLDYLWPYSGEWFEAADYERALIDDNIISDPASFRHEWMKDISAVLSEATLPVPSLSCWMQSGGKSGIHTEHLGHLMSEMQYLQRAYPDLTW